MTNEFCNTIQIYLRDQVDSITNEGLVIAKPGENPIVAHASDLDITPAITDSKASLIKSYTETLYIDKLQPADASRLKIKRSVILQFKVNTDQPFVIGSLDYPARLTYTPNLNTDILKIEHKQPAHI